MALLKPFRQYSENDVVNMFAYDGSDATRGAMVKLSTASKKDWKADWELDAVSINNSYANTTSDRYAVTARVALTSSGDAAFGMLMHDVKEYDENGEKLIWHPRKAHEMQVSLSGQAVPVLTRGIVLVNGIDTAQGHGVAVGPGVKLYAGDNGSIMTHTDAQVPGTLKPSYVGYCIGGAADDATNKDVLIKLDCDGGFHNGSDTVGL
jgi:hypothetical protein